MADAPKKKNLISELATAVAERAKPAPVTEAKKPKAKRTQASHQLPHFHDADDALTATLDGIREHDPELYQALRNFD